MIFKTYAEIKAKVERDLDLAEETFIVDAELLDYCNDGIDEAEAEINGIYEDYFLAKSYLSLVSGTADYSLPSGIYANKIRCVVYSDGSNIYEVMPIQAPNKFEEIAFAEANSTGDDYRYYLTNDGTNGIKMTIVPTPAETTATRLRIWYFRNATRMTVDASICDIPEFISFVIQFMKVRCYEKEGHSNLEYARAELERQRQLMVNTLTNMVPDENNSVAKDVTHYEEST